MDIALVSVIATSVVAIASVLVQGVATRGQREHEAALAFESRVWGVKSDALLRAIRAARGVRDRVDNESPEGSVELVRSLVVLDAELNDVTPAIETYGSSAARTDLLKLRAMLRTIYYEDVWIGELDKYRADKVSFIENQDFEHAAMASDHEKMSREGLLRSLVLERSLLADALANFIESARLSVRSDRDRRPFWRKSHDS